MFLSSIHSPTLLLTKILRRDLGATSVPLRLLLILLLTTTANAAQSIWHFNNLHTIANFKVEVEGHPRQVTSPVGSALQFDGKGDSVLIDGRPLVGAATFTAEVVFKPEGGQLEQRFMHIAETDQATGLDAPPPPTPDHNSRIMFEVRVVGDNWYLDTHLRSKTGVQTLASSDKLHPLDQWYVVAQTYDGKTYRSYVNGVLEEQADVAFTPHGPGRVRLGARMNHLTYFHGAVAEARFTDRALPPEQLLQIAGSRLGADPK